MTGEQTGALYGLTTAVLALLNLGMSVAFLVGAFVVRRTRPDAFGILATSSVIHLGNLIFTWAGGAALTAIMWQRAGPNMDAYAVAMVLMRGMSTVLGLVGNGLLLAGILRLAKGPQAGNPFAEGRYQ